jgi:REP element-mobilizing transposase RayT
MRRVAFLSPWHILSFPAHFERPFRWLPGGWEAIITRMQILAYFLTWTTYGTWLPGDERGWVNDKDGAWHVDIRPPEPERQKAAKALMKHNPVILDDSERALVRQAIADTCRHKAWALHEFNVRTNHVHVVVSVGDRAPEPVMAYLKSWASRRLNEAEGPRDRPWWTEHGSTRYIKTEESLAKAIEYVRNQ